MTISHPDMVATLAKSGELIAAELTPENAHLLHMTIGIVGEAGELLDAFDQAFSFGKDLDNENIVEELGDCEFYIEGFRQGLGVTRDEVLAAGFHQEVDQIFGNQPLIAPIATLKYTVQTTNLLDLVKKVVVYQKDVPTEDIVAILSKMEILLMVIRDQCGFQYGECLDHNINKLGKRYEGFKYSDNAAQVRADKAE